MAEATVVSLLSEFVETAARLNTASDSLNTILSGIETRLVNSNAGIEAWLDRALTGSDATGSTGGETSRIVQRLGFAKIGGEWCLAVKAVEVVSGFFEGDTACPYLNEYKAGDPIALQKASREIRVAALEAVPYLIELLTEEANRRLRAIDQAKQLVE